MTTVRAKLQCSSVKFMSGNITPEPGAKRWPRAYEFYAVYDTSVPEDQRYATATPYAKLEISVDNPAVHFEPGKAYYVDFVQVDA